MAGDAIPLEYVCARWAYSELLSAQPYYGSELKPLREKLARGVPFDELDPVERALLLRKMAGGSWRSCSDQATEGCYYIPTDGLDQRTAWRRLCYDQLRTTSVVQSASRTGDLRTVG